MGISETNFDKVKFINKINSMALYQAENFAKFTSSTAALQTLLEIEKLYYLKNYILNNSNINKDILLKLARDTDCSIKTKALTKTPLGIIGNNSSWREIISVLGKVVDLEYLELMIDLLEENASACCEIAANKLIQKNNVCLIKLYAFQGCSSALEQIENLEENALLKVLKEHPEIKFKHGLPATWPNSVFSFIKGK